METLKEVSSIGKNWILLAIAIGGMTTLGVAAADETNSIVSLPGWMHQDVGPVGRISGTAQADAGGVVTLSSAGSDIWGPIDSFHFVYQSLNGDGQVIARFLGLDSTNEWAKAGLMVRETLGSRATDVFIGCTPGHGVRFQWRTETSAETLGVPGDRTVPASFWMKVARRGNWFAAYTSADGASWTLVNWQTLSMTAQAYVGLAVASHDAASACTASFDRLQVSTVSDSNPLPFCGTGDGLASEYFCNPNLTGSPGKVSIDPVLDFDWGWGAPPDLASSNLFSVRWTGEIQAQFTEPYTLSVESDDGARLWLDDQLLIDAWIDRDGGESSATTNLIAGQKYKVRVEYYDNQNVARVCLRWASPSTPKRAIPQSQLYAPDTDADGIPDIWELSHGLDPNNPNDANNTNQEGLTWLQAYRSSATTTINWGVPAPWTQADVGLNAGSDAGWSNGVFTVVGFGSDIWSTNDAFHFVYQPVTGNVQIVARLLGAQSKHEWAKAGIMIRDNLGIDSQHAMLVEPAGYGLSFQWRSAKGEETFHTADDWWPTPYWLKLVRWDDWVGSYKSSDGINWKLVDWEPVQLGAEIYAGLVSCSHDDQSLCTARFDNVQVLPATAPDQLPVLGTGDGLRGDYFDNRELVGTPSLSRVDSTVNFGWHFGSPLDVLYGDNFSVRWTGEIQPRYTEPYTFYLETDDGVKMWLNEQLLINDWNDRSQGESMATINLVAGQKYLIRIEYYEHLGAAEAHVKWSSPSTSKRNIPPSQLYSAPTDTDGNGMADLWELHYFGHVGVDPDADSDGDGLSNLQEYQHFTDPTCADSDGDGMPDQWEIAHGLSPSEASVIDTDSDADGLSDLEEYQRGTDPQNADTDGDGIPDGLEVKYLGTDPLVKNPGLVSDIAVAKGSQAQPLLGQWQVDSDDIYGLDRRGQVQFNLSVPRPDKFLLKLEGTQNQQGSRQSRFSLLFSVDGESLGHRTLVAGFGTNGAVAIVTPFLAAGQHTVKVYWDEGASSSSLRIRSVKLSAVIGPDANGDGIKDWVEKMVNAESGVDGYENKEFYTSPACLEGHDPYPTMMALQAGRSGGQPVVVQPGAGQRWFANVPLSTESNTDVAITYQNGVKVQTAGLHWSPINVLEPTNLLVRVGDSLLLTARASRQATLKLTISQGDLTVAEYTTTPGQPVPHLFATAGSFKISAVATPPHGAQQTGSISVTVIGHTFPENPICLIGSSRDWDLANVAPLLTILGDPRLKLTKAADLPGGAQRFALIIDQNEPRSIVSRVGLEGPILAVSRAEGIRFFPTPDTYNRVIQQYADGTRLVETMEIVSPVPTNITVQVKVIVGGVTFDDGTVYREITARDFDSLGQYKLRFILPPGTQTANCHRITIMQGTSRVGAY